MIIKLLGTCILTPWSVIIPETVGPSLLLNQLGHSSSTFLAMGKCFTTFSQAIEVSIASMIWDLKPVTIIASVDLPKQKDVITSIEKLWNARFKSEDPLPLWLISRSTKMLTCTKKVIDDGPLNARDSTCVHSFELNAAYLRLPF
jgi:hypothetical protein